MSRSSVPVKLQPRAQACHAVTAWHADSALLVCTFEYTPGPKPEPPTVAQRIDAALGISITPPRALLGDIDVTWQDESRLHTIELRTGRSQWEPCSLEIPSQDVEAAFLTFDLDYDVNRVASVELNVRVLWDAMRSRIALRMINSDPVDGVWIAIADNVFARVDGEQTLIELLFENVQIVSEDPPN